MLQDLKDYLSGETYFYHPEPARVHNGRISIIFSLEHFSLVATDFHCHTVYTNGRIITVGKTGATEVE